MNIITNGIDRQNRRERDQRRETRRNKDIESGLTRSSRPARGDYRLCRALDKTLKDYSTFKDPRDRVKIKAEYEGLQREQRPFRKVGK